MATVTNTARRADLTPIPEASVTVVLAGEGGEQVDGYLDGSIFAPIRFSADEDGEWSVVLPANTDPDLIPTGTVFKVTESGAATMAEHIIEVPTGSGTHALEDLLTDPPGTIATAAVSALDARLEVIETVSRIELATSFLCSRQEGGKTVKGWGIIPAGDELELDIDIAATAAGWGGGGCQFAFGDIADRTEDPWEPGGENRVARRDNLGFNPLTGVTEFEYRMLGAFSPDQIASKVSERIVLTGLTPGKRYDAEVTLGGQSFSKQVETATGAGPTYLATVGDSYVLAACTATSRLYVIQTGWEALMRWNGVSPNMATKARIALAGAPLRPVVNPSFTLVAIPTGTVVTLVDLLDMSVDATYAMPGGVSPFGCVWSADGTKLYVGATTTNNLYRFDVASRTWDTSPWPLTVGSGGIVIPFTSVDRTDLYAVNYLAGTVYRITPATPSAALLHTSPSGGASISVGIGRDAGDLLVADSTANRIRHLDDDGTQLGTLVSGAGDVTGIDLDYDQVRVFWGDSTSGVAWAWIDTHLIINQHNFAGFGPVGDVKNTPNEGTLVALTSDDTIFQFPGGNIQIRPDEVTSPYGTEHLIITCRGGVLVDD